MGPLPACLLREEKSPDSHPKSTQIHKFVDLPSGMSKMRVARPALA
jgi:hypothetical protein